MDPASLAAFGLPGLFLAAFLAGSIVPLPSEAVAVALVAGGVSPAVVVGVATAGNLCGAATLYALGIGFHGFLAAGRGPSRLQALARRFDSADSRRAATRLRRYGAPLLLLSWLPVAGDALVVAAGTVGVRPLSFLLFTTAGKALRYVAVVSAATAMLGR